MAVKRLLSLALARWGCSLDRLPPDHEGPRIVAGYLGQMAAAMALMLSVERIVFGGGVMSHPPMLGLVREAASLILRVTNKMIEGQS